MGPWAPESPFCPAFTIMARVPGESRLRKMLDFLMSPAFRLLFLTFWPVISVVAVATPPAMRNAAADATITVRSVLMDVVLQLGCWTGWTGVPAATPDSGA